MVEQAGVDLVAIAPNLIVGLVLAGFAWAFRSWSESIKGSTQVILNELKGLSLEFHKHRIDYEKRATKVEVELAALERRITRAGINGKHELKDTSFKKHTL